MTAIRDAMTRAGVNTAGAELRAAALNALKNNRGDVQKAAFQLSMILLKRRDLLGVLTLDYVRSLAGEPEAVAAIAPPEDRKPDVKVRPHARHRPRTDAEREAALRAGALTANALSSVFDRRINGRPIGDLQWGELTKMVHENAADAASFLKLGTDATANAILLKKIQSFAQVSDHTMPVRQVVGATQLQTFIDQAYAEAPEVVQLGMRAYAKTIAEKTVKEVAA